MTTPRRLPPQDLSAEQGILAACLNYGVNTVAEVRALVGPSDFYDRRHGKIFEAACWLQENGHPVDELTITSRLNDAGQLQSVGGPAFLAALADAVLSPAHGSAYARLVKDKAHARQMLEAMDRARDALYSMGADPSAALQEVDHLLMQAREKGAPGELVKTLDIMPGIWSAFEERCRGGKDPNALRTGFGRLDRALGGGMRPGDLVYVAGRPGMGKTALLASIAANVAVRQDQPVLFASLEQPPTQLVSRLLCSESLVSTTDFGLGRTDETGLKKLASSKHILSEAPLFWLGRIKSVAELAARARLLKSRHGLRLVVFDYVQRMAKRQDVAEIALVSGALKDLALDLGVPVLAAVQLSREVEKRNPPEPVLSDLKGAGDLEQDADIVALLYRPAYYTRDLTDQSVKVAVAKQRNGPTGVVDLIFKDEYVRFVEAA